jgi:mevalonate kinase
MLIKPPILFPLVPSCISGLSLITSIRFRPLSSIPFDFPSKPMTFIARSALPMGAGLGSSAAYSTCIALALLRHRRHLPSLSSSSLSPGPAFDAASIDLIDGWAFLAEKVIHGNPSGIDNAVSVRGGAVVFKRKIEGVQEGRMESLKRSVVPFHTRDTPAWLHFPSCLEKEEGVQIY